MSFAYVAGTSGGSDDVYDAPLVVNQGEYVSIICKEVIGTVLSNSQIRGTVTIIGYWE
jgi:hypothetical protein